MVDLGLCVCSTFLFFGCFDGIYGQIIPIGCPEGWELHSQNCYKFVYDLPAVVEEADAECWSNGASLVSVDSLQEQTFISDWLMENDAMTQSLWFTSGIYSDGKLFWERGNAFADEQQFWIRQPKYNENGQRVVYAFGGSVFIGYGWNVISGSFPANYICEISRVDAANIDVISRDFEYGSTESDPQDIKRGPYIDQQPVDIIIIDGAVSVEIECSASGYPFPDYTWWSGRSFENASQMTSAVDSRYTLSSGRLTIQDPSRNDIGSYHCRSDNEVGSVYSNKGQLVYGFIEYFQNIEPEPIYATVFKGAKLDCNAPAHSPAVGYEWFKNQATNIFVWPSNGNMFVSQAGFLYFSEVQPTDGPKRYFCIVSLVAPDGMKMAKANAPSRSNLGLLLLLDSGTASDNNYGPILNTHAFPSPALVGRTIRLECIAYGTHPLFYSWRREGGRPFVPGTVLSAHNRVLTIKNAQLEAEGNYVCRCVRGSGDSAEKILSVSIETKPYFPFRIKDMLVDPGMTVNWYCKSVARPAPTYSWYKNGVLLNNRPGKIEVKNNVLRILSVDERNDEGMYQCAATNQHGTTFSSGQLKVLSFAPNFYRHPMSPTTLAPLGGNVSIPCMVEAAPKPEVRWFKNGADMNLLPGDTSGRIGMTSRYSLVMTSVQKSDQATYTCRASNNIGDASGTTMVKVIDGIQIIQPPQYTTVQVNRTAFMYCQASYDRNSYDLSYVWHFNGRPINYHLSPEYVSGQQQSSPGLYIKNAQFKNMGTYECVAMTSLHSSKSSATLEVIGPPGAPAGVYAGDGTVTSRSVRLIWTVGNIEHGAAINSYDIEAETNYHPGVWGIVAYDVPEYFALTEATNGNMRGDQRSAIVQNLIPYTSYRFRVRATNLYGRGQKASSPSMAVRLSETAPVVSPRNVNGGGGSEGTLTITWDVLDIAEYCGPNLDYIVFWKRLGDERDWIRKDLADIPQLNLLPGVFVETIGAENYYQQYQAKVQAYNENGPGPNSTIAYIYSAEGMPVSVPKMRDIESLNATSVMVFWDPVQDDRQFMKGRVAGYRIYFYEDKFGETPYMDNGEPDPIKNEIKVKDVYGQTDHALLIGLEPMAEYYARVQVFNNAGAGPKGEWRWAETANQPLRQYPRFVEVSPRDDHSVNVKWRGVSISWDEESLDGYIMRVWKVQEDIRTATDIRTEKFPEAVIDNLQSQTVYELRVLGHSRAGDGALSEAVYFTVLGGNVPFDPSTSSICYSSADGNTCGAISLTVHVQLVLVTLCLAIYRNWIGWQH